MAHTTRTRLQDRPSLPSRATRVGHGPSARAKPLQERRVDLDLLAGALAGAAAVWVMDRVVGSTPAWPRRRENPPSDPPRPTARHGPGSRAGCAGHRGGRDRTSIDGQSSRGSAYTISA